MPINEEEFKNIINKITERVTYNFNNFLHLNDIYYTIDKKTVEGWIDIDGLRKDVMMEKFMISNINKERKRKGLSEL